MIHIILFLSFTRETYRLGDGYFGLLSKGAEKDIIKKYPNSILSEYLSKKQDSHNMNQTLMMSIINRTCKNYEYPPNPYTAIHLRTGDVVCGTRWHEIKKRPHSISYYNKYRNDTAVYIFSKPFFSVHSSKPCVKESNEYTRKVLKVTNGKLFNNKNADHALCTMVKANKFVLGKGYFSKTIEELNKKYRSYNHF